MTGRFLIMVEWRGGVQAMLKIRHHWGKQLKKDNGEYCMSMLSIGATASQVVTRRATEQERLGVAQGCSRHTAVFPLVGQREMTHIAQNQRINWDSPIREPWQRSVKSVECTAVMALTLQQEIWPRGVAHTTLPSKPAPHKTLATS